MANKIQIDVVANNKASGSINDIVRSLTGFSIGGISAAGAVTMLGREVIKAVNETQKYNLAMVDLARNMGTSTEEASRMVQVGDDLRISQQSIETAMKFAIKNGIEPNINGIANLSDQYVALGTPIERGQFLLDNFGRSGLEMSKMMEKGGQAIRDMAAGIEGGLIVTEKAALASQQYFMQVDALNDSLLALKMNVGNAVIPVLNEYAVKSQAMTMTNAALGASARTANGYFTEEAILLIALNENLLKYGSASAFGQKMTMELAGSLGVAGQSALDATDPVKGLAQSIGKLQDKDIWITTFTQTIAVGSGAGAAGDRYTAAYRQWAYQQYQNQQSNYATTGHANGGITDSNMTWVGENGPELAKFPAGTRIHTNQESKKMAGIDYDKLERTLTRVFRNAALKA